MSSAVKLPGTNPFAPVSNAKALECKEGKMEGKLSLSSQRIPLAENMLKKCFTAFSSLSKLQLEKAKMHYDLRLLKNGVVAFQQNSSLSKLERVELKKAEAHYNQRLLKKGVSTFFSTY